MSDWYLDKWRFLSKKSGQRNGFISKTIHGFIVGLFVAHSKKNEQMLNYCNYFYLRWWNNGTLRARLCSWMSPALPASRAAACTKWSLADVQGGSCKKQGPSTSTSASRSSVEPAWRSLRAIATTPSGRSVFVSFVTIKHECVVCELFVRLWACASFIHKYKHKRSSKETCNHRVHTWYLIISETYWV